MPGRALTVASMEIATISLPISSLQRWPGDVRSALASGLVLVFMLRIWPSWQTFQALCAQAMSLLRRSQAARFTVRFYRSFARTLFINRMFEELSVNIEGCVWFEFLPLVRSDTTLVDLPMLLAPRMIPEGHRNVFSLASRWMDQCNGHKTCGSFVQSGWLPLRLVEISTSESKFRVIETAGIASPVSYFTLSHCWGDADIPQLRKDSKSQLERGMDTTTLPKTFQDALSVCRAMSTEYIWIDSLCICQDDRTEWEQQSKEMSKVYENALCNIAANLNGSSHGGIFIEDHLPCLSMPLQAKVQSMVAYEDEFLPPGDYHLVPQNEWELVARKGPLNQRGWVMQERLLARSVLHFTGNGPYWECNELVASLIYPDGIPQERNNRWDLRALEIFSREAESMIECGPFYCAICEHWVDLVELYTQKRLTYPNDRPIAIAGLAKRLESTMGDQYIAGKWSKHLRRQLGWITTGRIASANPSKPATLSSIPSFSWLSVDAEISAGRGEVIPEAWWTIEEVHVGDLSVTLEGIPTQVGWLRIRACLKSVRLNCDPLEFTPVPETPTHWHVEPRHLDGLNHWYHPAVADYNRCELSWSSRNDEHFLMPYGCWKDKKSQWIRFLILEAVKGGKVSYRRIGGYVIKVAGDKGHMDTLRILGFSAPVDPDGDDWDLPNFALASEEEKQTFYLV